MKTDLNTLIDVRSGERSPLAWSFLMFFAVLASYLTVRPLREAMGASLPKGDLAELFAVVLIVMVVLVPVFGAITTRLPRRLIVPVVYGFFISNLVAFSYLMRGGVTPWLASTFFVWVSVYNLFVVSLFWSLMANCWSSEAGKRLFGVISAGGTLGALTGPLAAARLAPAIGTENLALVSAGFLAVALAASFKLARIAQGSDAERPPLTLTAIFDGARQVACQPYLLRIALFILLANLVSTFFYLEQSRLVKETITGEAARVSFFAWRDFMVSVATACIQLLGTARILTTFGLTAALAALPVVCLGGLLTIGLVPTLAVVSGVMVVERITAFALAGPAIRVLYTVVDPDDKYKAQNFIDTVVYRAGDAASGWLFGIAGKAIVVVALPFALAWLIASRGLERMHQERAGGMRP